MPLETTASFPGQGNNPNVDSLGRNKTSPPFIWGKYQFAEADSAGEWSIKTNGAGASTWNNGQIDLTVTASAGDFAIRQTKQWHPSQGVGNSPIMSLANFHVQAGVTKLVGPCNSGILSPWDDYDGAFLYNDGASLFTKVWNNGVEYYSQASADWEDRLDGSGPSRVTINWEYQQRIRVDFSGGTGTVRWLILTGEKGWVIFDEYNGVNTIPVGASSRFMRYDNQPIRYEIRSTGGAGTFIQMDSSWIGEKLDDSYGLPVVASNKEIAVNATSISDTYAILGIRINPIARSTIGIPRSISITSVSNDDFVWNIQGNPVIGGPAPVWTDIPGTGFQQAVAEASDPSLSVITTPGAISFEDYGNAGQISLGEFPGINRLGTEIDGIPTETWITVSGRSIGLDALATVNGKQI